MSPQARILPANRRVLSKAPSSPIAPPPSTPWDPDAAWRIARTVARALLAIAVLVAGVAAAVGARRYVTTSPRFGLKDLRVEGARHRSVEQIVATAGVSIGQNVVDVDVDAVRTRLEADPWIERVSVARRLPASLTIEVVEREPALVVALPTGAYLTTAQGVLFKRIDVGDPADLPVLTGLTTEEAGGDKDATSQIVRRALELMGEIERVGLFGGHTQELHVDGEGGLAALVGKRAVRLVFGRGQYRSKVRIGARIETELIRRNARPTVVFLDDDQHPERVVVRLVSALPPATVTVDAPDERGSR